MIQPVSPIVSSPSLVIAVQSAPPPAQLDVASGPLPQPTASDAANFRDAAASGGVEVNKVQEVTMPRLAPANRVWSHAGKSLSESLNGMSALEATVNQSLRDYQKPSASKFTDRSEQSSEKPGPDGSSASSSSRSSTSLDDLSITLQTTFQTSLTMMEFTIEADLMSKSAQDSISSVKQLANGGAG